MADERAKVDQIRRYLRYAYGKVVHRSEWKSTGRDVELLVKDAMREVEQSLFEPGATDDPGPASLELAVRAAYPLVVTGRLNADRGTANNEQPDRRNPGEVLDAMRRTVGGVHQLAQALRDYADGKPISAVDEDGKVRIQADGSGPQIVNDIYLRNEYPPPGKPKAAGPGRSPTDRYDHALRGLASAIDGLDQAFAQLCMVMGDDGQPLVESRGVETRLIDPWREQLKRIEDELAFWGRTFKKAMSVRAAANAHLVDDFADDEDPYADTVDYDENGEAADESDADQPHAA